MNSSDLLAAIGRGSSKSTDKLALLIAGIEMLPKEKLNKVKRCQLNWECVDGLTVPTLDLEFFE